MANLTAAHHELFRRGPDERYPSLEALLARCGEDKERSRDRWELPKDIRPVVQEGALRLALGSDGAALGLNDWSFTQLCGLAGRARRTR